ncbi:hypothetical protein [Sporosalibacterium faouarense]|uniref:hypothetical protein n=1 Tax=Sporosalibacterium faouarense TaxID=516123 RepID=UPI00141D703A|nr:hypothetical protein [Sporosalibacterium faouarense]MTI49259.1 hypothetical protein [Bacillota bacterium]
MGENNYVWTKEGYIGCNMLHSNYKSFNYKITFLGAEQLNENKWKINLLYSCISSNEVNSNGLGYSANISIVVEPMEKMRFESYLGIKEGISVEFRNEEQISCTRFFPVQFVKFIYIEKDYIKYEVHCI